jgi:hypothetical protein
MGFLTKAAHARYAAWRYMSLGEMMRAVKIESPFPTITTLWKNFGTIMRNVKFDGVMTSSWLGEDGTVALVFTNITESPQQVQWSSRPKSLGLGAGPWKIEPIYPVQAFKPRKVGGSALLMRDTVEVGPLGVTIVKIASQ